MEELLKRLFEGQERINKQLQILNEGVQNIKTDIQPAKTDAQGTKKRIERIEHCLKEMIVGMLCSKCIWNSCLVT